MLIPIINTHYGSMEVGRTSKNYPASITIIEMRIKQYTMELTLKSSCWV